MGYQRLLSLRITPTPCSALCIFLYFHLISNQVVLEVFIYQLRLKITPGFGDVEPNHLPGESYYNTGGLFYTPGFPKTPTPNSQQDTGLGYE